MHLRLPPFYLVFALLLIGYGASGQVNGGRNVYEFLNLAPSARATALGGNLITVMDDDVGLAYANPALLNAAMHQQLTFNHNFHLNSIKHGYAAYGHYFPGIATFHFGAQYAGYGEFQQTDETGQVLGTFKANDYSLTLGAGRRVDERLFLGANLRFISSQLEGYNSLGLSADAAAAYRDTSGRFLATIVFRNIGAQLTTYSGEGEREPLPFDIQVGLSTRLRHLPFRFSVIYHSLNRWNILYDDPNTRENEFLFGEFDSGRSDAEVFFDNFFRHFIFNGEFLFGKTEVFRLRFGYNHLLRKEMTVDGYGSLAGFSFGVGVKVYRFRIDYGHRVYHIAGGVNHIGISTNFREFRR